MFALVADVSSACARAPVERPDTVTGIVVVALAVVIGVTLGLSASSTEGSSGGDPSIAHRRSSYLLRMKLSTLWSGGGVPLLQTCLPICICTFIPPLLDGMHLLRCPDIKVNRFNTAYVRAHAAMNTGTTNAQETPDIPRRPSRIIPLAVRTLLILWLLHE